MKTTLDGNWAIEAGSAYGQCIRVKAKLFEKQTKFQKIEIFETCEMGRLLMLDGIIQLTGFDEFAYQEMMAHLPYYAHGNPENVLVIGGGDGGVLRELARHKEIKTLDICEIDADVIAAAKEFLPELSCGYDDPRVNINVADGSEFIRQKQEYYDLVIVDSTDPGGPGAPLFSEKFYADLKLAMRPGGVVATQAESPWLLPDVVKQLLSAAGANFKFSGYGAISVPTYPTGMIGVCTASDSKDITRPAREVEPEIAAQLRYYNGDVHRAAFAL
ncbi:MAG: polyamine aminopropyltransferase, partial [Lentisphaeria bacterium]|nr:polyamine aminopropyltransferase [Lentisphaeria bacterium]